MAEAIFLAALLGSALVLFYTQWLRPDITALLVMLALMVPWRPSDDGLVGVLNVEEAASGFGSPAVIMVAGMFVISAAMVHSGAARMLGRPILEWGAKSELRLQLVIMGVITGFSAFINDTTTVVMWMPMVLAICREHGYSPARMLMPLAFASLLGGQWTLIGTRSNIIISDYLRTREGVGLGFLEFTPIAVAVFLAVMVFFVLVGRKLLPKGGNEASLAERYDVAEYLTELLVAGDSALIGRTLNNLDLRDRFGVRILGLVRGADPVRHYRWVNIRAADVLVVRGRISQITELLEETGLSVKQEMALGEQALRTVDLRMAEAVVAPGSKWEGRTLDELDFGDKHDGVSVLAIGGRHRRPDQRPTQKILRAGDSLLMVGHSDVIDGLRDEPGLFLLESRPFRPIGKTKAWLTIGILALVVVGAATRVVHAGFAIPAGAVLCILLRCVSVREAYDSIHLSTLVILGGLIPFGLALENTGTAHLIGDFVHRALQPYGLTVIFAALLLVAIMLTQLIENAAVAVILAPLAYELAVSSGGNPEAFLLGLAICVSTAFMSPVAHESTILVMTPGGYRFKDYLRVGTPLALLTWIVTVLTIPLFHSLAG